MSAAHDRKRVTSLRTEAPKANLRQIDDTPRSLRFHKRSDDTPRSLRFHKRSEHGNVSVCKPRTSKNNQFGDNVPEKRKNSTGVDPVPPSAKRKKISLDAIQQQTPVPCDGKSAPDVWSNRRRSSEPGECRVLRPRKRQISNTTGGGSWPPGDGFQEVRLAEADFFGVINRRIKVFWGIDNEWYTGWIKRYDPTNKLHHVVYDDQDEEWVSLERDIFMLQLHPGESLGRPSTPSQGGAGHSGYGCTDGSQEGGIRGSPQASVRGTKHFCRNIKPSQNRGPDDSQRDGVEAPRKLRNRTERPAVKRGLDGSIVDSEKRAVDDPPKAGIEASQRRSARKSKRLRLDVKLGRDCDVDDADKCGIVDGSDNDRIDCARVLFKSLEDVDTMSSSAFSSGSDVVRSVSQKGIAETVTDSSHAELVCDKTPDALVNEPVARRMIVKTYYRKRRRKLINRESEADAGKVVRLVNSEKTLSTYFGEHRNKSQGSPLRLKQLSSCPCLVPGLRLFSRGLANVSGSGWGFVPDVVMEICLVDNLAGLRKLCFWGTFWEVLSNFSASVSSILRSEKNRCSGVASGAPRRDDLHGAIQSISVRLSTSSDCGSCLECRDKMTTAKWIDLKKFLTELGVLPNPTSHMCCAYTPLLVGGSVCTFQPGFTSDLRGRNAGNRTLTRGPALQKVTYRDCFRDTLCIYQRHNPYGVIANKRRTLPSFSLSFSAAPDFFMSLHWKLLLGNLIGLDSSGSCVLGSSYMLNGPDINNSKAGVVGCNETMFSVFQPSSEVLTEKSRGTGNSIELSEHQRTFGEAPSARFKAYGCPLAEHLMIEGNVSPRNTSEDWIAESSCRSSNFNLNVASTSAGGTFRQNIPVLPVLKFRRYRTTSNGKWRLVEISKPSINGATSRVVESEADWVSHLPRENEVMAVQDNSREWDKFDAPGDNNGSVESSPTVRPPSTFEIADDIFFKAKGLHRRGRRSRQNRQDRLKEIMMECSNVEPDLDSASCSVNILLIGEDRCWRESHACVELESSGLNEWALVVKLHGLTKFSYKPQQLKPGTSKRNTHAIIWKGGKDWRLEFPDKNQWNLFRKMHEECYDRNLRAASIRYIPIPGVRLLEDNECSSAIPFVRPSSKYIQLAESETSRALASFRIVYDMDSDDEEWLGQFNSSVASDGGCRLKKTSEKTFERIMDMLEKAAFTQQSECLSVGEVAEICSGLGPMEVLTAVHAHWLEKRRNKGKALVRQFQEPPSNQIKPQRKQPLQKRSFNNLSFRGRQLGRDQEMGLMKGFNLDALSRVQEARTAARVAAELAAAKRTKAQKLMQIADLATYRSVVISKTAEAIQAIETAYSMKYPNDNRVIETGPTTGGGSMGTNFNMLATC